MKNKILCTLFMLLTLLLCSCSVNTNSSEVNKTVAVTLVDGEHYDVISNNLLKVKQGQDAIWDVLIDDGYTFSHSSNGVFDGNSNTGKFIVKNIQTPMTVSFETKALGDYTLEIKNNTSLGTVTVTPNSGSYNKGEEITISVTPNFGNEFMCITKTYPFRQSATSLSPSGKPCSFESPYTFTIEENLVLYINYFTSGLLRINYDANGGKTIDGANSLTIDLYNTRAIYSSIYNVGNALFKKRWIYINYL